jgi:hypothetical protein
VGPVAAEAVTFHPDFAGCAAVGHLHIAVQRGGANVKAGGIEWCAVQIDTGPKAAE